MPHAHALSRSLALTGVCAIAIFAMFASVSFALAAPVEMTGAFVCPVITSDAVGEHNPQAGPLGATGDYTVVPETANSGNLVVPVTATNGDEAGTPGGDHAVPGDTDYTAIWAK